jgi:hypothetical protein
MIETLTNPLLEYGFYGILIILLIAANVYQSSEIRKKDKQLLDVHVTVNRVLSDLAPIVASINETTNNIPDKVKANLKNDFDALGLLITANKNGKSN